MKQLLLPDYKIGSSKHVDNYKQNHFQHIMHAADYFLYASRPKSRVACYPFSNVIIRNSVGPYNFNFKCSGRTIFVAVMIKAE